jgi:hypothetical protein
MMSLFLALHVHAAKRGDGLLPEFLRATPQPRDALRPANEHPATQAEEKARRFAGLSERLSSSGRFTIW